LQIELTPVDRLIAQTPLVGVGEYVCPVDHPQFRGGGPETCPYVVFSRYSVHLRSSRGTAEVCSPATVNLLDVGDSYERGAISTEGVHCDWIAISPSLLREIAREHAPQLADSADSVFVRAVAPVSAATFIAQRRFFAAANASRPDALALEESALRLVSAVMLETTPAARPAERKPRRNGARRYDIVETAKHLLAQDCSARHSLVELARNVHCSPAYLSRSFARLVGCSLHAYLQQLRLRASLDLLGECRYNAAAIAAQLGFSSHSHFTYAFRRTFGVTPSEFARSGKRNHMSASARSLTRCAANSDCWGRRARP